LLNPYGTYDEKNTPRSHQQILDQKNIPSAGFGKYSKNNNKKVWKD